MGELRGRSEGVSWKERWGLSYDVNKLFEPDLTHLYGLGLEVHSDFVFYDTITRWVV